MKHTPPITKEKLNQLYEDNNSIHKVGIVLNVSGDTISRWLKVYNITIKNDPKRFDSLREVKLNEIQKDLLIGSMLGDGNLHASKNGARLRFCHGIKQIEYLNWKRNVLSNFVVQKNNMVVQTTRNSTMSSFQTIRSLEFKQYHEMFYNKNKIVPDNIEDLLTPLVMSVWFMDDGWRHKKWRTAVFCTDSFLKNENEMLVRAIKNKFDINANLRESSNRIVLYGDDVDKLSILIKPYIIPSMMYKIGL